jgi:hypothetical protein
MTRRCVSRARTRLWGAALLAILVWTGASRAATLTVSPSVVSNTYNGVLTLNITGLTNGEQVALQQWLDFNTNGVVDPGELMIDAFKMSEGGGDIIGGIRNLNVPWDSNPATNAITTTLIFTPNQEGIVGHHILRLVSPTHRFAPTNATFLVTNAALGQFVAGTVFMNGAPVSNAAVLAYSLTYAGVSGGAMVDSGGHYALALKPGIYALAGVRMNAYADLSVAPLVILTNGAVVNTNLFITNAAATISGFVYDAATSNALGGVSLSLSSGNLFSFGFTDTNGIYSAEAAPGQWKIGLDAGALARRAYVVPQTKLKINVTSGSVSNGNFALSKANAIFYGRLTNSFGVPLANIRFDAGDNLGNLQAGGFTDANGDYVVAVLSGTSAWTCGPAIDQPDLDGYVVSGGLPGTILASGGTVMENFTALAATGQIAGHFQDYLGNLVPLTGIRMSANASIGGLAYSTTQIQSLGGTFSLGVVGGLWIVNVDCCDNHGLNAFGYYDPGTHLVVVPPTNAVLDITIYPFDAVVPGQPARLSATQVGFNLIGLPGTNDAILATTNLALPLANWFTALTATVPATNPLGSPVFLQDNQATNGRRFYRAKKVP